MNKVRSRREKGIVLVLTLVLLASISFMASYLYFKNHRIYRASRLLEFQHLSDRFLPEVTQKVLALCNFYQKKYGSVPREISFVYEGGNILKRGRVFAKLSPEAEKCNLNQQDEESLLACLQRAGIAEKKILILRDSILDWVDQDEDPRPFGAEKEFYETYAPQNAPLKDLLEVLLVRGWDPYHFWGPEGLFDKVTVYGKPKKEKITEEAEKTSHNLSLKEGAYYRLLWKWSSLNGQEGFQYLVIFRWGKSPQIVLSVRVPYAGNS